MQHHLFFWEIVKRNEIVRYDQVEVKRSTKLICNIDIEISVMCLYCQFLKELTYFIYQFIVRQYICEFTEPSWPLN